MVDDWGIPSYREESINSEILDSGIKQIREHQQEKQKELNSLQKKVLVAKSLTPLKRLSNKLQSYSQKKALNKNIIKKDTVQVDIKKLVGKEPVVKDKARYYKENYTIEKRKLFFS